MRASSPLFLPAVVFFLSLLAAGTSKAADTIPFYTQNQSPLIQIFGLPAAGNAVIASPGHGQALLSVDVASNHAVSSRSMIDEAVVLDGESLRTTVALHYGIAKGMEVGFDLPLVGHSGGFLDGFIEGWHDFFGLPQGGRKEASHGRLLYSYEKDGGERLRMTDSSFGLGDVRLSGAVQLYHNGMSNPTALALRTSLKLPTGNSGRLHGSGSTDIALWLSGRHDGNLDEWGHWSAFGALGGMAMTNGKVLQGQQRNLACFGSIGIGWSPIEAIGFKTQLSGHTAFYGQSRLSQLGDNALQLLIGGTIQFSKATALDIGVSEDIAVATSPDVAFHLALSRRF